MYPEYSTRQNNFSMHYSEIAIENYYIAKKLFNNMKSFKYIHEIDQDNINKMQNSIMISVVFSSMCIEAFFNDYTATCLGDKFFYDNFDSLSVISKFQLISKFILKTDINKELAYYSLLKKLVSNRNSFVHNKSKDYIINSNDTKLDKECFEHFSNSMPSIPINIKAYKEDLTDALDGLKAIKEIATHFDKYDTNIHAIERLFGRLTAELTLDDTDYKKIVLKELGILKG